MGSYSEGLISAEKKGSWGFLDIDGNEIIPFVYKWVLPFKKGIAKVTEHNGSSYFVDKNGDVVDSIEN